MPTRALGCGREISRVHSSTRHSQSAKLTAKPIMRLGVKYRARKNGTRISKWPRQGLQRARWRAEAGTQNERTETIDPSPANAGFRHASPRLACADTIGRSLRGRPPVPDRAKRIAAMEKRFGRAQGRRLRHPAVGLRHVHLHQQETAASMKNASNAGTIASRDDLAALRSSTAVLMNADRPMQST